MEKKSSEYKKHIHKLKKRKSDQNDFMMFPIDSSSYQDADDFIVVRVEM